MSNIVHVVYLKDQDRCVVFTDGNMAREFCGQNEKLKTYVADLNPPILWRYAITFFTDRSGFVRVEVEAKHSYNGEENVIIHSYSGPWTVFVKAKDEEQALLIAKATIRTQLAALRFSEEGEKDDYYSDCVYSNSLT